MQRNERYPPLQRKKTFLNSHAQSPKYWKNKRYQQMQRKLNQKRIFGDHYNYNKIGLNKEKKYMLEQQKNTEIQRSNRILFEKIKKIGQRSANFNTKMMRIQTEQVRQDYYNQNSSNKWYLNHRQSTPFRSTQQQTMQKLSQFQSTRKTNLNLNPQNKMIFKGHRQIDGIDFAITIYIENNNYIIYSEQGNMEHRIQMSLENYKTLLKQSLNNVHTNIFDMLKFNGTLLELIGTKRQQINIIQEQQLTLPAVSHTPMKKYRSNTTT